VTRLIVHVGYPKTASSTLQAHLFANSPGLHYLGRPFSEGMAQIERAMLTLDDKAFVDRLPSIQAHFRKEAQGGDAKPIMISHEGFLRSTRFNGHDVGRTAERIHQVFVEAFTETPDTEIIICLRNQPDLFLSHFVQFVKGTQGDLDRQVDEALANPKRGFSASLLYSEILDRYAKLFGKDRLHLFTFEEFVTERQAFLDRLSRILNLDPEMSAALLKDKHEKQRSKEAGSYALLDRDNATFKLGKLLKVMQLESLSKRVKAGSSRRIALSSLQKRELENLYRASNKTVEATYRIDLTRHGYAT